MADYKEVLQTQYMADEQARQGFAISGLADSNAGIGAMLEAIRLEIRALATMINYATNKGR